LAKGVLHSIQAVSKLRQDFYSFHTATIIIKNRIYKDLKFLEQMGEVTVVGFGSPGPGGGFEIMFTIVPIFIVIIFIIVIGGIIFSIVRYVKNASSPKESTFVSVVAKRMEVRHHSHPNNDIHHSNSSRTYYYITLEFDNGERKEYLDVKQLYGLVVEGDTGFAQIQGEWIVAFERSVG
jgi:hypothetical protein